MLLRKTIQAPSTRKFTDTGMTVMVLTQVGFVLGPPMPSVALMAVVAESLYVGFAVYAWHVDRQLDDVSSA